MNRSLNTIIRNARAIALAFFLVGFSFLSLTAAANSKSSISKKPSINFYFAEGDKHQRPQRAHKNRFGCSDKIYAVVELKHMPKTKYDLSITWIDPSDTERERTEYPFTVSQDDTRLWSWLSLSRATGAALVQWVNPAAGLEEFIGPWNVEVRINNRKISTQSFEVIC